MNSGWSSSGLSPALVGALRCVVDTLLYSFRASPSPRCTKEYWTTNDTGSGNPSMDLHLIQKEIQIFLFVKYSYRNRDKLLWYKPDGDLTCFFFSVSNYTLLFCYQGRSCFDVTSPLVADDLYAKFLTYRK